MNTKSTDKGKSKRGRRRRGHNYIKRITRVDPVTGEIEQQCSRCGEWWFQDKQFWWYFNGEPAPTCKACHDEARSRNKAPVPLPALKPSKAKKTKQRRTTPVRRPDGYWQRNRAGVTCSSLSFGALERLVEAERDGWPFVPLPGVHQNTINALVNQNWVIASDGLDGMRYSITAEGKRVHRLFSKPPKRTDGICPVCGVRPKHRYPSGTYGYCLECDHESKRRNRELGRPHLNPNRLCSACHERPLHRMSGGKFSTYCTECRHAKRAAEKRAQHDRDLARIRNGEVLLCRCCKKRPRAYTERYVRDRCNECQQEYMAEYNDRRRPGSEAAKSRKQVQS